MGQVAGRRPNNNNSKVVKQLEGFEIRQYQHIYPGMHRGKIDTTIVKERIVINHLKPIAVERLDPDTYAMFDKQAELLSTLRLIYQFEAGGKENTTLSSLEQEKLVDYLATLNEGQLKDFKENIDNQIRG